MDLYHTGNIDLIKDHKEGRFGEFLFFSCDVYWRGEFAYELDASDLSIIDASSIFYQEESESSEVKSIINELAESIGVDYDTACNLIDESENVYDIDSIDDHGEASWDVQHYAAKVAKAMGYDGVCVDDEQGAAYMIDMTDRLLKKVDA